MTKLETSWSNVISVSDDFQSDTNCNIGKWWAHYLCAIFFKCFT